MLYSPNNTVNPGYCLNAWTELNGCLIFESFQIYYLPFKNALSIYSAVRLHFFTATFYPVTPTQERESGLMQCAEAPQQLMHFHAALTLVRALWSGEAERDTLPNGARWPVTRKTTASCCAATISLGLVFFYFSRIVSKRLKQSGVTFLPVCLNEFGVKLKSRQAGLRLLGTYGQQMRRTERSQDFLFIQTRSTGSKRKRWHLDAALGLKYR